MIVDCCRVEVARSHGCLKVVDAEAYERTNGFKGFASWPSHSVQPMSRF